LRARLYQQIGRLQVELDWLKKGGPGRLRRGWGGLEIVRPNQVWATDITYIRLAKGFAYLVAILDWFSRYVISWELALTLEADFCVRALARALARGRPACGSAWTGVGGSLTTSSSSGCGGR
jgi:transposase InsO family protein